MDLKTVCRIKMSNRESKPQCGRLYKGVGVSLLRCFRTAQTIFLRVPTFKHRLANHRKLPTNPNCIIKLLIILISARTKNGKISIKNKYWINEYMKFPHLKSEMFCLDKSIKSLLPNLVCNCGLSSPGI